MITYLKGILTEISPANITVEVNGIGYVLLIPLSSFDKLPKVDSECKILTYLHVREDIQQLYGFATHEEKYLFKLLITVSGIGPKMALTILSGMTTSNIKQAIASGDTGMLTEIPGIGRKTAQRLILELKDQVPKMLGKSPAPILKGEELLIKDAINALINLGYKQMQSQTAVEKAVKGQKDKLELEQVLKEAFKYL